MFLSVFFFFQFEIISVFSRVAARLPNGSCVVPAVQRLYEILLPATVRVNKYLFFFILFFSPSPPPRHRSVGKHLHFTFFIYFLHTRRVFFLFCFPNNHNNERNFLTLKYNKRAWERWKTITPILWMLSTIIQNK